MRTTNASWLECGLAQTIGLEDMPAQQLAERRAGSRFEDETEREVVGARVCVSLGALVLVRDRDERRRRLLAAQQCRVGRVVEEPRGVVEQVTDGDPVTVGEESGRVALDGVVECEHAVICEPQGKGCDERLRDARDTEARTARRLAGRELAHLVSLTNMNDHARNAARNQIARGLIESRRRVAQQERDDRHEGGRRESCEPEPAHPA